jgi:hypothetical protein
MATSSQKPSLMFDKDVFQGLGWKVHERLSRAFRVTIHPPLLHEIAGDFVEGKANSRKIAPTQHVATLLRKFGGSYNFSASYDSLCARELRGEAIAMDGSPYPQDHVQGFDQEGNPIHIMAREGDRTLPVQERWAQQVLADRVQPIAPEDVAHFPFDPQSVLGEAHELLSQLAGCDSNEALVARVRTALENTTNARALIRFTADSCTPVGKARERLRLDAQARWRRAGRPAFTAYPFASHSASVVLLYFGGIRYGKVREAHDRSDLQHLKHLPLADLFASDDKLVQGIGAHLLRPGQRLVSKQQLLELLATQEGGLADLP